RAKLAALLWGDRGEAQARDSLRQALSLVRKALSCVQAEPFVAHEDTLIGTATTISLVPDLVACDVARFEALIREGSRDKLAKAADLYKGQFFANVSVPEEAWADWLTGERQRLEGLAVDAMIRLAEQELQLGHQERSLAVANRAVSIDNLREDAHR